MDIRGKGHKKGDRKHASRRCLIFNCRKSLFAWQCCQFCIKKEKCKSRCRNDLKKCGSLLEPESQGGKKMRFEDIEKGQKVAVKVIEYAPNRTDEYVAKENSGQKWSAES